MANGETSKGDLPTSGDIMVIYLRSWGATMRLYSDLRGMLSPVSERDKNLKLSSLNNSVTISDYSPLVREFVSGWMAARLSDIADLAYEQPRPLPQEVPDGQR